LLRAVPFKPGPPVEGAWTVGYLVGTTMNRDYWICLTSTFVAN
jgi:hypothetical protein